MTNLGKQNQKYLRALQGAAFSLGAPLGWLIIRTGQGIPLSLELINNHSLYSYMTVGTMLVFIIFGYIIGKHEDELEKISIIDPLTKIYNYRYFYARLNEEFSHAKRHNSLLSIAIIDLDRFKNINDQYGHLNGDKVLYKTAKAISSVVRDGETVARVGGEEFAILFPGSGTDIAFKAAERIRKFVEANKIELSKDKLISVTISVGVACIKDLDDDISIRALYEKADNALYQAKNKGRNMVETSG